MYANYVFCHVIDATGLVEAVINMATVFAEKWHGVAMFFSDIASVIRKVLQIQLLRGHVMFWITKY